MEKLFFLTTSPLCFYPQRKAYHSEPRPDKKNVDTKASFPVSTFLLFSFQTSPILHYGSHSLSPGRRCQSPSRPAPAPSRYMKKHLPFRRCFSHSKGLVPSVISMGIIRLAEEIVHTDMVIIGQQNQKFIRPSLCSCFQITIFALGDPQRSRHLLLRQISVLPHGSNTIFQADTPIGSKDSISIR